MKHSKPGRVVGLRSKVIPFPSRVQTKEETGRMKTGGMGKKRCGLRKERQIHTDGQTEHEDRREWNIKQVNSNEILIARKLRA